jgi:hypothetical protein
LSKINIDTYNRGSQLFMRKVKPPVHQGFQLTGTDGSLIPGYQPGYIPTYLPVLNFSKPNNNWYMTVVPKYWRKESQSTNSARFFHLMEPAVLLFGDIQRTGSDSFFPEFF